MSIINKIESLALRKVMKAIIAIEVVDVYDQNNNYSLYNACYVVIDKKKTNLKTSIIEANEDRLVEWISPLLNGTTVVLINVNTDKILNRIENKEVLDIKELISNASSSEFTGNNYTIDTGNVITSYSRIQYLNQLLEKLSIIKNNVVDIVLGPSPILMSYHLAFENNFDSKYSISFSNHIFNFDQKKLINYTRLPYTPNAEKTIAFGGDIIPEQLLIPYAQAINFLLSPTYVFGVADDKATSNKGNIFYTLLSKRVILGALVILFVSLGVSTFIFSHYNTKYDDIQAEYEFQKKSLDMAQIQNEKQERYKKVIIKNGLDKASYLSLFSDQITKNIPNDIYLKKLEINPVDALEDNDDMTFQSDKIVIEGSCFSSTELNEWINKLRLYSWIKKININEYSQSEVNDLSNFKLEVFKDSEYEYQ